MHAVSKDARFILDRMEPDRRYEARELRAVVPDLSAEGLRAVMHELWVSRHVERAGDSGWRRHRSAPAHQEDAGLRQTKVVRPEDLFDHDSFTEFFQ
jgi:hypothetical protein